MVAPPRTKTTTDYVEPNYGEENKTRFIRNSLLQIVYVKARKLRRVDESRTSTGVLILQNAKGLFLSQDLASANYRAESAEILHDTLLGDSTWVSRAFFLISIWGLTNGVSLGDPLRGKKS